MIDEFREDSIGASRRASTDPSRGDSNSNSTSAPLSPQQPHPPPQQQQHKWQSWGPSALQFCAVTPCFRGGFLFRLYDEPTRTWAFYNDTFTFEMHCTFIFEAGVPVEVLTPRLAREQLPLGETRYTTVIYPMETVEVMRAVRGRNKAQFDGKALSREYLARQMDSATVEVEAAAARVWLYTRSAVSEEVLQVCKAYQVPFVDPEFRPASVSFESTGPGASAPSSIGSAGSCSSNLSSSSVLRPGAWRRPEVYLPEAWRDALRLFRAEIAPSSVQRGELGDSWVISAIAALAENPKFVRDMFRHPVSPAETHAEERLGARRVLLNKDGLWQSTLIDSYLPMKGQQQRFARSADDFCEMWVSYLEKAYAKRNTSYGNIISGDPLFALRDFTGFPTTRLDAKFRACRNDEAASAALFDRLAADCDNGHHILLSTPLSGESALSAAELKEQGILVGYAYTVLGMAQVTPMVRLLRVRNPWAPSGEWRGAWAAGSPHWERCPEARAAFPTVHDNEDDKDNSNDPHGSDCTSGDRGGGGSIVLSWEEVLTYFIGCGVVFNHFDYADYRVPSQFRGTHSRLCLEVSVTEPTQLTFVLSQEDRRTRPECEQATGEYAPLVISIASAAASSNSNSNGNDGGGGATEKKGKGREGEVIKQARNSSLDSRSTNNSSSNDYDNVNGVDRDDDEDDRSDGDGRCDDSDGSDDMPGYRTTVASTTIIHLLNSTSNTTSNDGTTAAKRGNSDRHHHPLTADKADGVDPTTLSLVTNSTADTESPTSSLVFLQGRDVSIMHTFLPECSPYLVVPRRLVRDGDPVDLPYVIGILSQLPFTTFGQAQVRLRQLPAHSPFYGNYVSFENATEPVEARFQVRRSGVPLSWVTASQLNPEA